MYVPSYQAKLDQILEVLREYPVSMSSAEGLDGRVTSATDEASVKATLYEAGIDFIEEPHVERSPEDFRIRLDNGDHVAVNIKIAPIPSNPNTLGSSGAFAVALCGLDALPTKMSENELYERIKGKYPSDRGAYWILLVDKNNPGNVHFFEIGQLPEEAIYINPSNGIQVNTLVAVQSEPVGRNVEERAEFLVAQWVKFMNRKVEKMNKWIV